MKRTIRLTNAQYVWYVSVRNVFAVGLVSTSPAYCNRDTSWRVFVVGIAILGMLALVDELFVRIDGQPPREYYRTHDRAMPKHLYTVVFAFMAAILFIITRLVR